MCSQTLKFSLTFVVRPEILLQRLSSEDLVSPSSFPFGISIVRAILAVLKGSIETASFGFNQSLR